MATNPGCRHLKVALARVSSLGLGLILLVGLWSAVDTSRVLEALSEANGTWLAVGYFLLVPAIAASAWRFRALAPADARPGLGEAVALVLAASALNQVLPAKVGDLAKAWWLAATGRLEASRAFALVALEKLLDLAALLVLSLIGLLALAPGDPLYAWLAAAVAIGLTTCGVLIGLPRAADAALGQLSRIACAHAPAERLRTAWAEARGALLERPTWAALNAVISLGIWMLLLFQVWAFARGLGADLPLGVAVALAPLAIVVGLFPVTFAGIGTRDAALVVVFSGHLEPPVAAAVGVLVTLRYLLTALAGLPFCMAGPAARARTWAAEGR